jgi:hypothetical protein
VGVWLHPCVSRDDSLWVSGNTPVYKGKDSLLISGYSPVYKGNASLWASGYIPVYQGMIPYGYLATPLCIKRMIPCGFLATALCIKGMTGNISLSNFSLHFISLISGDFLWLSVESLDDWRTWQKISSEMVLFLFKILK